MNTKWFELAERFQKLRYVTGADKSSSYSVHVNFSLDDGIWLTLGTYDVADWPRATECGPFQNEEDALQNLERVVIAAEQAVQQKDADNI